VAYVVRAHGIKGDVLIKPLTERVDRFAAGATLFLGETSLVATVRAVRSHNDGLILSLAEISDRNGAEALAKSTLTIDAAARRDLEPGEYWPDELVGLEVVGAAGEALGTVTDVVLGDAQDRLVVTGPLGERVEVPFVAALVGEPHDGVIRIDPPIGLFGAEPSAQIEEDT
jgi:16S rRNA processing protein RimM